MPAKIQNRAEVATTPEREQVLQIIEAGLAAIDTAEIMRRDFRLGADGTTLHVKDKAYSLANYDHVYVLGAGKASGQAAEIVEEVLGERITAGVVIAVQPSRACKKIEVIVGTHPLPSAANVTATQALVQLAEQATERDLVICIVSGGGSALLCGTTEEQEQGVRLYTEFLKSDGEIIELDTVRKHISNVKGGGLAKMVYPATAVGLIFSDIAGDNFSFIASGPTYLDATTVHDAQAVIDRYRLGTFNLNETPKGEKFFEKISNVVIVSNVDALEMMRAEAQALGLRARVLSSAVYVPAEDALAQLQAACDPGEVVLAGGEIRLVVTRSGGTGGRCQYLATIAAQHLGDGETFCAFASDGADNGDCAGAVVDASTLARVKELGTSARDFQDRFDGYGFCAALGHTQIFTGRTNANVADFMVLLKKA